MKNTLVAFVGLGGLVFLAPPAAGQLMTYSVDFQGQLVGNPDAWGFGIINEGDILSPALPGPPLCAPDSPGPPPPGKVIAAVPGGAGAIGGGLGINNLGGFRELDALSYGRDIGDRFFFSVDEFARGAAGPSWPNVRSEGAAPGGAQEAAADVFEYLGPPDATCSLTVLGNTGFTDGDGAASASGAVYPGVGLYEPNPPGPGLPDPGDNLDAVDLCTTDTDLTGWIFFSLDSDFPDTREVAIAPPNTQTAQANGFVGGDVLVTVAGGAPSWYIHANDLGLDLVPGAPPDDDDLDALALWDNGDGIFDPAVDQVFFSVREDSALVVTAGILDSRCGLPIEAGDILTLPDPSGATPYPAIWIPAEALGLRTRRTHGATYGDDLDALDLARNEWRLSGGGSYNDADSWTLWEVPDSVGAVANFLGNIIGDSTVTVDSPVTVGTINFDSAHSYTIDGPQTITMQTSIGVPQINVEQGHHTIEAPLSVPDGLTVDTAAGSSLTLGPYVLMLSGGPINLGPGTTLKASGYVNGLVVDTGGVMSPSTLQAVGPMVVGVLGSTAGYNYAGILDAGPHAVVLLDDDKADVGIALIAGGSLTGAKGIQLNPATVGFGGFITGDGEIHGVVTAGTPGNPAMGFGGVAPGITVYGDVIGLWNQFDNTTVTGVLHAGFSPAHNPLGPGSNAGTAQFLIGGPLNGEVTFNSSAGEYEKTTGDHTQFLVYGVAEGQPAGAPTVFESLELKLDEDYPDFGWDDLAAGDDIVLIQTAPWQTVQFITLPFPHYETTLVEPGLVDYGTSFEGDLQSALDLIRPKLGTGLDMTYTMNPDGLALHIIPEPGTLALLLSGGLVLIAYAWRRRQGRAA